MVLRAPWRVRIVMVDARTRMRVYVDVCVSAWASERVGAAE